MRWRLRDSFTNKVSLLHLAVFAVLLPFDRFYSELVLVSFALHTLINRRRQEGSKPGWKPLLALVSVYLLTLVSTLWSNDRPQALSFCTRQLAILLFPLLLSINRVDLVKYRPVILNVFTASCVACILWLYIDALRTMAFYHLPLKTLFTRPFINHNFSLPLELHATYLSMFAALSLAWLMTGLYQPQHKRQRFLTVAGLIILSAGLIQLGSRSVLIAVLLMLFIFPLFYTIGRQRLRLMIALPLAASLVFILVAQADGFKTRFYDELKADLTDDTGTQRPDLMTADPRIERWELAEGLVKAAPLLGYGSGDEVVRLKEQYFAHGLYNAYVFDLNAHNQYLSFLLRSGLLGLIVYLLTLGYGLHQAIRSRDGTFTAFLLLLCTVSLSENYLDVNKGIFFYAFFFSFFLWPQLRKGSPAAGLGNPKASPAVFIDKA